jgi:hypothetical protein
VLRLKPFLTPQSKFEITEALVAGDAQETWSEKNREVTEAESAPGVPTGKTDLSFKKTLGEFIKNFFPKNAARIHISYMTHHLKKPTGLSVRECVSLIKEINRYLEDFPHSDGKQLSDFVLIDLLNKFVPRSWQADLKKSGLDVATLSLNELTDYFERLETIPQAEKELRPTRRMTPVKETRINTCRKNRK